MTRRTPFWLALPLGILFAAAVHGAQSSDVRANLAAVEGSGVTGIVQLTSLPQGGGTKIVVTARGLRSGGAYAAFYHETGDCSGTGDLIGTFVADENGNGSIQGMVSNTIEQIGSVSVQMGLESGTLQACAATR